jgi:hypothetical protein
MMKHFRELESKLSHSTTFGLDARSLGMADAASIGRGGLRFWRALPQHQPVARNSPLLAVKHELEPIGEQRLEHQHQLMIAGRVVVLASI